MNTATRNALNEKLTQLQQERGQLTLALQESARRLADAEYLHNFNLGEKARIEGAIAEIEADLNEDPHPDPEAHE